jgi:shikimate dehydrogenase
VAKATELVQRTACPMLEACGFDALPDRTFDLVVNATSSGLSGEVPRIPASVFRKGALAYELVYGHDTAFLAMARQLGATTSDGTGMLVEQAADSFRLWRGVRPQTAGVIAALRRG